MQLVNASLSSDRPPMNTAPAQSMRLFRCAAACRRHSYRLREFSVLTIEYQVCGTTFCLGRIAGETIVQVVPRCKQEMQRESKGPEEFRTSACGFLEPRAKGKEVRAKS